MDLKTSVSDFLETSSIISNVGRATAITLSLLLILMKMVLEEVHEHPVFVGNQDFDEIVLGEVRDRFILAGN